MDPNAQVPTPPANAARPAVAAGEKPRVLIVDDSRVIRKAISKILTQEFELVEAEDGEAGWEQLLADDKVQVMVADVEMPRLDGYSLICRVRAYENKRVREVPIIVITGGQDDETRERAFACGATDFITKPIDSVQLLARTRAHARLDQTTRKLNETAVALEEQSAVDPLTQLHSRKFFLQRGVQDYAYAARHGVALTVVRIDIDNFRAIYGKYGDEVCDQMLIWLAKTIATNSRTEDTAARIAGGEFAVIAPSTNRMQAAVLCERIRNAVAATPFRHGNISLPLTVSLGIATTGRDTTEQFDELLRIAEERMTYAKASGGNRLGVSHREEAPPPEEAVMEEPDAETALKMLNTADAGKLVPYLPILLGRFLPLLEFCNKKLDLGLSFAIDSIKDKLNEFK